MVKGHGGNGWMNVAVAWSQVPTINQTGALPWGERQHRAKQQCDQTVSKQSYVEEMVGTNCFILFCC